MGDRGAFSSSYGKTGGIPSVARKYSEVGKIGRIKVIQSDETKNNHTITYSNTKNTTYFAYSKERHKIERIYYYRNHRLYKSVDFKDGEIPHTHYWSSKGMVGRKTHGSHYELDDRDKRLMNLARTFKKQ